MSDVDYIPLKRGEIKQMRLALKTHGTHGGKLIKPGQSARAKRAYRAGGTIAHAGKSP